jgi:hypothetical protein
MLVRVASISCQIAISGLTIAATVHAADSLGALR